MSEKLNIENKDPGEKFMKVFDKCNFRGWFTYRSDFERRQESVII